MSNEIEILDNKHKLPPIEWPEEFDDLYLMMSSVQQRALVLMASGLLSGLPQSRMLKFADSCEWCGKRTYLYDKKTKTADHSGCHKKHPRKFAFAASASTFEGWKKRKDFKRCLDMIKLTIRDHILGEVQETVMFYMVPIARKMGEMALSDDLPPMVQLHAGFGILDRGGFSPQAALWREQRKEEENTVQLDFWGKIMMEAKEVDPKALIENQEASEYLDTTTIENQESDL